MVNATLVDKNNELVKAGNNVDLSGVLSPITLPCGLTLQNRLVKAATYEHLAPYLGGPPGRDLHALYSIWGAGGWGMIITGNVQVSSAHLSLGADMVIPSTEPNDAELDAFCKLASAMRGGASLDVCNRPRAIMQISHSGRQSPRILGGRVPFLQRPVSASATRVGGTTKKKDSAISRIVYTLLFERARAMDKLDIQNAIDGFVRGAKLAERSGFDGVQLHGAHGYLITQFMSRKTNFRSDTYALPLAFLREVVREIREAVSPSFALGLKLNSADYVDGGSSQMEGTEHLAEIASWEWNGAGVDFIEISGGDYESPEFMSAASASPRQAFFENFARVAVEAAQRPFSRAKSRSPPLIMLTDGLRTPSQFSFVLHRKHANLLGVARLATLQPQLPQLLSSTNEKPPSFRQREIRNLSWEAMPDPAPQAPTWWPSIVGAGVGMAWHNVAFRRLARGRPRPFGAGWLRIILEMYFGEMGVHILMLLLLSLVIFILGVGIPVVHENFSVA